MCEREWERERERVEGVLSDSVQRELALLRVQIDVLTNRLPPLFSILCKHFLFFFPLLCFLPLFIREMESESESESEVRKPTRMKVHFESSVVVPEQAFEAAQTFYQAAFSFRETFTINDHKMYKKGRNSLCLRWTRFDE